MSRFCGTIFLCLVGVMKFGSVSVQEDRSGRTVAFFSTDSSVGVSEKLLGDMKRWSKLHGNVDLRVCLHTNRNDRFHQMIILAHKNVYYRPHKETRPESYQMMYGRVALFLFSEDGKPQTYTVLDTTHRMLYRVGAQTWHVSIPLTPLVMYHEAKAGPVTGREITFAPWAPVGEQEGRIYIRKLLQKL